MLLLLGTLIGPSVMWIALDGTESDPRSKQAEKDKNPIDQKSRSVLVNNPVNRPTLASIRPAVGATAETLPDAPVPHAAVPDQRTVADAQRRALIAYPALDVANSPLRLEYLARRKRYLVENKKFFNDADWPMKLAEECQQAIEGK